MRKIIKPELLAPAGSFDGMRAAINAGADAVYMGGEMFGARAYAQNPDEAGLIDAIEFCHIRNKKLYLTVNTLLKEEELKEKLYSYLKPLYVAGLDAVIVQDIGVMEFIGYSFPGLDIHVSTQASVTMAQGIQGIRGLLSHPDSITRVVPARELSMEELRLMRNNTDLEMEVFIHGALCCCYSGQCLMSSLAGGRSGNRGRCAQPCRRLYEAECNGRAFKGYYLSPKDMCTLDSIGDLIDCGIDSFKIEGRMKSVEYAAGVVSIYREYIDSYLKSKVENNTETASDIKSDKVIIENIRGVENREIQDKKLYLSEIYNRGGFNEGYLHAHNGKEMMSTLRPGHHGVLAGNVIKTEGRKVTIKAGLELKKGDVLEIRDLHDEKTIYEFTVGDNFVKNDIFSVLTMKDKLASKGASVFRTKNNSLLADLKARYVERDSKVPVLFHLTAKIGEPLCLNACLKLTNDNSNKSVMISEEVTGQPVQKAETSVSDPESIKDLLGKLGNTPFYASNVDITADSGIFLPVQEIKRLRRECVEKLVNSVLSLRGRKIPDQVTEIYDPKTSVNENSPSSEQQISISLRNIIQLKAVLESDKSGIIKDICMEMSSFRDNADAVLEMVLSAKKKAFFKLPRILRNSYYDETKEFCEKYKWKASFIATSYESIALLKEIDADYRTDHNLYCYNNISKKCFDTAYTLPVELNETELRSVADRNGELIVYGLLPVMVSAQCVYKTVTGKCGTHSDVFLKDEKGFVFRAHSECRYCYNLIYNSAVLCLFHRLDRVAALGCGRLRLDFSFENEEETGLVIRTVLRILNGSRDEFPSEIMGLPLTNGHFNRGVE